MSVPASARPPDPQPVHLYYSKPRALLVLALNLAVALWLAYLALVGLLAGHVVLLVAGLVGVVFVGPVLAMHALQAVRALTQKVVVVTLDAAGVTDTRKKDPFLAWEDIGQVTLGSRQQNRAYLIFDFRSSAVARSRSRSSLGTLFRVATSLGDWHVNLRPLKCDAADVLRTAQRLHQGSIRKQVIERNGPASKGWSGVL